MSGTLNDETLIRATLVMPRWGIWWADVQVATSEVFSGQVTLTIGGLSLKGTVISGGSYHEQGWYRIVAGNGGWRTIIDAAGYRNESGVKLGVVLQDAARACGENLGTIPPTSRVGPAFARPRGEASRVLDLLSSEAWHIDNDGITQLGLRASTTYEGDYTLIASHPSRQSFTVQAEDLTGLVPGAQIEDVEVSSVRHELTPTGLRSHVWADPTKRTDRQFALLRAVVRTLLHPTEFHKRWEYRVTQVSDGYLDLRPVRSSLGLPDLANVPMRVGIPGGGGAPQIGTTVLVGFVDGDPTRPYVCDYEGEAGAGWLPTTVKLDASQSIAIGASTAVGVDLAAAEATVLRSGDFVTCIVPCNAGGSVTFTGPITLHPSMAAPGPPMTGKSKVKA